MSISVTMSEWAKGWLSSEEASTDKISVKRIYIDINNGNLHDGLLFSQIMYWHGYNRETGKSRLRVFKDGYYWVAKRYQDWWNECRINERTARSALSRIEKRGLITTKTYKFNSSPTKHIRINWEEFEKKIKTIESSPSDIRCQNQMSSDVSSICHEVSAQTDARGQNFNREYSTENIAENIQQRAYKYSKSDSSIITQCDHSQSHDLSPVLPETSTSDQLNEAGSNKDHDDSTARSNLNNDQRNEVKANASDRKSEATHVTGLSEALSHERFDGETHKTRNGIIDRGSLEITTRRSASSQNYSETYESGNEEDYPTHNEAIAAQLYKRPWRITDPLKIDDNGRVHLPPGNKYKMQRFTAVRVAQYALASALNDGFTICLPESGNECTVYNHFNGFGEELESEAFASWNGNALKCLIDVANSDRYMVPFDELLEDAWKCSVKFWDERGKRHKPIDVFNQVPLIKIPIFEEFLRYWDIYVE